MASTGSASLAVLISSVLCQCVFAWKRQFGTSENDVLFSVALDSAGDVYAVGYTKGTLPGQTSGGGSDFAVVRLHGGNGSSVWALQFGTGADDSLGSVALDSAGGVYAVGSTEGELVGQKSMGGCDFAAVRLRGDGSQAWAVQFGTSADDRLTSSALDLAGDVYAVGLIYYGGPDGQAGGQDFAAVRLRGADGTLVWMTHFGTSDGQDGYLTSVALDSDGDVYAVGYTSGTLEGQANIGNKDFVAVRFRGFDGSQVWRKQFGTRGMDLLYAVVLDSEGDIYAVGETFGTLVKGHTRRGMYDFAAVRLRGGDGSLVWAAQFGTSSQDHLRSVALDRAGDVYAVGETWGTLEGQTKAGEWDFAVVRLRGGDGALLWAVQFGTSGADHLRSVALDCAGNVFAVGHTYSGERSGRWDFVAARLRGADGVLQAPSSAPSPTPCPAPGVAPRSAADPRSHAAEHAGAGSALEPPAAPAPPPGIEADGARTWELLAIGAVLGAIAMYGTLTCRSWLARQARDRRIVELSGGLLRDTEFRDLGQPSGGTEPNRTNEAQIANHAVKA